MPFADRYIRGIIEGIVGTHTTGFTDGSANRHGDRALSDSLCGLCGVSAGYARWHLASERLDTSPPRQSRHCVTDINGGELCGAGAIRAGAARLDLRAGAHRGRQVRAANVPVTGVSHLRDAAWLRDGEVARLLALLDRDGEEARVVSSAVRNTLLQLPVAEIDVATMALLEEVMRRVRAAGGKAADRHRARHRHCYHRSSPGRGHNAAASWRNLCC